MVAIAGKLDVVNPDVVRLLDTCGYERGVRKVWYVRIKPD